MNRFEAVNIILIYFIAKQFSLVQIALNNRRGEMAKVCTKIIEHEGVFYKKSENGWLVEMYGTYGPRCNGIPSYRFMPIPEHKVPREVRSL